MPVKKRMPVGRRAPAAHVKAVRRIMRAHAAEIATHATWLHGISRGGEWSDGRTLGFVKRWWKGVQISIEQRMLRHARKKNNRLRIWEDGPGKGLFGSALKEELERAGIKTHLTATTLDRNSIQASERPFFDEIHAGRAELFIPKKQFDFIFSTVGSVNYTPRPLRKEHLLKMAYSLTHGGQMFVAFYHRPLAEKNEQRKAIEGSLLQNPPKKDLHTSMEMVAIERAFAKRGFKAKFRYLDPHAEIVGLHVIRE